MVAFALALLVVAAVALAVARSKKRPPGLLSAVPPDAWLIVAADFAALRASPIAQLVRGPVGAARIPGLGLASEVCGFDPLTYVRELLVVSPEGGQRGEFGIAVSSDLGKDALVTCVTKAILARGRRPATSVRGSFNVIGDAEKTDEGRLAYRDGGPYLIGPGGWLDAMIDAADGKTEGARFEHGVLRERLTPKSSAAPTILLTALLPKALRERLKKELSSKADADETEAFASILAIESAGVSVATGGPGSTTSAFVELLCETPSACDAVGKLLERKRQSLSRDFVVRLVGLGPLLDTLVVQASGGALSIAAHAPTDDLARALQRLLDVPRLPASPSSTGSAAAVDPGPPPLTHPAPPLPMSAAH